jgi:hypothetical protein
MNSSLIVLENVSDYVKYEITPPSELKTEYDKQMKNVFAQRENRVNNLMQRAESMTENLKIGGKQILLQKKYPEPTSKKDSVITRGISENTSRRNRERRNTRMDTTQTKEINEVVMIGYGRQRKTDITGSVTQVLEGRASGVVVYAMELNEKIKI